MPAPEELLADLRSQGFTVGVRGERLAVAPRAKLTAATVREIRSQRDALFALVAAEGVNAARSGAEHPPRPKSPLDARSEWARAQAQRRLRGPACGCASCRSEDARARIRVEDLWRDY